MPLLLLNRMVANQRKASVVHDTHEQFRKMPKLTPIELSRMKAEKDAQILQEQLNRGRAQQEAARQQMMRGQMVAMQGMPMVRSIKGNSVNLIFAYPALA
jgi:dipeptidase